MLRSVPIPARPSPYLADRRLSQGSRARAEASGTYVATYRPPVGRGEDCQDGAETEQRQQAAGRLQQEEAGATRTVAVSDQRPVREQRLRASKLADDVAREFVAADDDSRDAGAAATASVHLSPTSVDV